MLARCLQVFFREHVKECLDEDLYNKLLQRIVMLQSWLRARLQRQRYLLLRTATINLQVYLTAVLYHSRWLLGRLSLLPSEGW